MAQRRAHFVRELESCADFNDISLEAFRALEKPFKGRLKRTSKRSFLRRKGNRPRKALDGLGVSSFSEDKMGKNRDYVVCSSCGDASWQFAYRAWKNPQCKFCGSKWSDWTIKGYRLSDYTAVNDNYWQPWQTGSKKNKPKAQAVLTEVWEFLPQQAKDMIGEAGWNPSQPAAPPGLEGWSSSPGRSTESQELVRSLWDSAEQDQRKVLEKLGLAPRPQPKTSLRDLCKLHAPDLLKEIQDLPRTEAYSQTGCGGGKQAV